VRGSGERDNELPETKAKKSDKPSHKRAPRKREERTNLAKTGHAGERRDEGDAGEKGARGKGDDRGGKAKKAKPKGKPERP
jgi:hypothetical protein